MKWQRVVVSSFLLIAMLATLVMGATPSRTIHAAPMNKLRLQGTAQSPYQTALMNAIQERSASGLPVPASVTFDYRPASPDEFAAGVAAAAQDQAFATRDLSKTTVYTATTVINFDNPQQAGYREWPALVVEDNMPEGASGDVIEGDYTEMYRQELEKQFPGIWDQYEFGQEPREYTYTETIVSTAGNEDLRMLDLQAASPVPMETDKVLMGFTYSGPDIWYGVEARLRICIFWCFEIFYFKAGFGLDWGLGLRLPTEAQLSGPETMVQGSTDNYYQTSITPEDWEAADYSAVGVAPHDGDEFFIYVYMFMGVQLRLFGINLCPSCYLEIDSGLHKSFEAPFGSTLPLGDWEVGFMQFFEGTDECEDDDEECKEKQKKKSKFPLGDIIGFDAGLGLTPSVGSSLITADWNAVGGTDCEGSGTVSYTEVGVPVAFGPVKACSHGPTNEAQVQLSNFKFWFNDFLLRIYAFVDFSLFGYGVWHPTFTVLNLDLSSITGALGLYLGDHQQCDWKFSCGPAGPDNILVGTSTVFDQDPPSTQIALSGTAGNHGWFVSDVQVTLNAEDSPLGCGVGVQETEYSLDGGVNWTTYTGTFWLTTEGENTVQYRSVDKEDNVEALKSKQVLIDKTPPVITGAPTADPNEFGWYNTDVVVQFTATDAFPGSGIDTVTPDQTLTLEGAGQSITGTAMDMAGNIASITVTGINIDKTAPVVALTSPEGKTYDNVETFFIVWLASDPLSGVDSESGWMDGQTIANGQLVELLLVAAGQHIVSAQAVDKAGNVGAASVTYFVETDIDGLLAALNYMCDLGWINKSGICKSLQSKLEQTKAGIEREQLNAAENKLNAFINELAAQLNKAILPQAFDVLRADAQYVMTHFILIDLCPDDPNKVAPGVCGCGQPDLDSDGDGVYDCVDACPSDAAKVELGICGCGVSDIDSDGDGTADCFELCPGDPEKVAPLYCGCGLPETDRDDDGWPDCVDLCVFDPGKMEPGVCGCGVADTDSDSDGVPDCNDNCLLDPGKVEPGVCGCGVADTDSDGDGTADCNELCPADPGKVAPGVCGCGVADTDSDGDGTSDCNDNCSFDPNKVEPGECGCGVADTDSDGDGSPDCNDNCPYDAEKTDPLICGCGVADTDSDSDDSPDCVDLCPNDSGKTKPGVCGCGIPDVPDASGNYSCEEDKCPFDPDKVDDVDTDGDGRLDCNECPPGSDFTADTDGDQIMDCADNCPLVPAIDGDHGPDTDFDGRPDVCDECPDDPYKILAGAKGCGEVEDGDNCPYDPYKNEPGICGCGLDDAFAFDTDNDGILECLIIH